jgi:hypothetical protein
MAKEAFNKKEVLFTRKMVLNLRTKQVECYNWSTALYGAENWSYRKVDQKYQVSFEKWCWRRMEKIGWTDRVRNEAVLLRVKEDRNILHTLNRRKAKWIGHNTCRNCLLKHVIGGKTEGMIEVTGRRGGRRKLDVV